VNTNPATTAGTQSHASLDKGTKPD
jgi:hypothetical protein